MDHIVHIELLVEDMSGKLLLDQILSKYTEEHPNLTYRINSFKGVGRLPKNFEKISTVKTHSLLNDLPAYLRGFNKSLAHYPSKKAIIVVVDCDDKDCKVFKQQLQHMSDKLELDIDTFFCIAIEEMEAWLLGDEQAVLAAYPQAKQSLLHNYRPDSIINTWEYMADVVVNGGAAKLKKETTYYEIGKHKCEWATQVGSYLNLHNNKSPSFNYLLSKLKQICS